MSLAFGATQQGAVARILTGRSYADLRTEQSATIDEAGARALSRINRWADYVAFAGTASAPAEWTDWLVHLAASMAADHLARDRAESLVRRSNEAMQMALRSYSRSASTAAGSTDLATTVASIRRYVVSRCVDREPPIFPSFDVVDSAIKQEIVRVWNDADWSHAEVLIKVLVAANGTVSTTNLADAAVTIDRLTTDTLRYEDGEGLCVRVTEATILAARADPNATPDRPRGFFVRQAASGLTWEFTPRTDDAYVLLGDAVLRTPTMADLTGMDAALALFPPEYSASLMDLIFTRVLRDVGAPGGLAMYREMREDLERRAGDLSATAGEHGHPGGPGRRAVGLGRMPSRMWSGL